MAKATNWKRLRADLPQRYTVPIADKIRNWIAANADESTVLGLEALSPRQVELVFKGKIKDSLKVRFVLRFALELKAEERLVRKMLVSRKRVKKMVARKP